MGASLHISKTGSSVLDSVFVCRREPNQSASWADQPDLLELLTNDCSALARAGVRVTLGDIRCLARGQLAGRYVRSKRKAWSTTAPLSKRLSTVMAELAAKEASFLQKGGFERVLEVVLGESASAPSSADPECKGDVTCAASL
jgi:hypothetical protein